jgi:hypothetical protein
MPPGAVRPSTGAPWPDCHPNVKQIFPMFRGNFAETPRGIFPAEN